MALSREFTEAERRALIKRETSDEILCDYPGCEKIAIEVLGVIRDINGKLAVCAEHLNLPAQTTKSYD